MRFIIPLLLLCSCFQPKTDSIDNVIEESIKRKEGVDIRIEPLKEGSKCQA